MARTALALQNLYFGVSTLALSGTGMACVTQDKIKTRLNHTLLQKTSSTPHSDLAHMKARLRLDRLSTHLQVPHPEHKKQKP
eukprot:1140767-Pelagomonas_calceolata.AAC.3